jgi:hypothetical protein
MSIQLDVNVPELSSNAVLWYESTVAGQGRESGKRISKSYYVNARTDPELRSSFYDADSLVSFVKQHIDANASSAILFSSIGFQRRNQVKKKLEDKIETRSSWILCLTCGLAVCCCGCCGCLDKDASQLNEKNYCLRIQSDFPAETTENPDYIFNVGQSTISTVEK